MAQEKQSLSRNYSRSQKQHHKDEHLLLIKGAFIVLLASLLLSPVAAGTETFHLSLPNTDTGLERVLGLGIAFPHPYYQRPRIKFPVYDRDGRGSLLYGYGGNEVYPYTEFDSIEGHH